MPNDNNYFPAHPKSSVKKMIAVISGKGGVGKSTVTSLLACAMNKKGYRVGILDADITGPSIAQAFNIHSRPGAEKDGLLPVKSAGGVEILSINMMLKNETDPVIWRGPVLNNTLKTFWSDVIWRDIDFLFLDMPPGTGDVPLTVFQSFPLDGCIVVTSPQDLAQMVVSKSVRMAEMMDIPVIGAVENYSYITCPDCGKKIFLFGEGRTEKIASEKGIRLLDTLPADPALASYMDAGRIEDADTSLVETAAAAVEALIKG